MGRVIGDVLYFCSILFNFVSLSLTFIYLGAISGDCDKVYSVL